MEERKKNNNSNIKYVSSPTATGHSSKELFNALNKWVTPKRDHLYITSGMQHLTSRAFLAGTYMRSGLYR